MGKTYEGWVEVTGDEFYLESIVWRRFKMITVQKALMINLYRHLLFIARSAAQTLKKAVNGSFSISYSPKWFPSYNLESTEFSAEVHQEAYHGSGQIICLTKRKKMKMFTIYTSLSTIITVVIQDMMGGCMRKLMTAMWKKKSKREVEKKWNYPPTTLAQKKDWVA